MRTTSGADASSSAASASRARTLAAGAAAVAVDGQMVDLPVVQRARAVLRDAGLNA
jgi:citrate lyase beta subunit